MPCGQRGITQDLAPQHRGLADLTFGGRRAGVLSSFGPSTRSDLVFLFTGLHSLPKFMDLTFGKTMLVADKKVWLLCPVNSGTELARPMDFQGAFLASELRNQVKPMVLVFFFFLFLSGNGLILPCIYVVFPSSSEMVSRSLQTN